MRYLLLPGGKSAKTRNEDGEKKEKQKSLCLRRWNVRFLFDAISIWKRAVRSAPVLRLVVGMAAAEAHLLLKVPERRLPVFSLVGFCAVQCYRHVASFHQFDSPPPTRATHGDSPRRGVWVYLVPSIAFGVHLDFGVELVDGGPYGHSEVAEDIQQPLLVG